MQLGRSQCISAKVYKVRSRRFIWESPIQTEITLQHKLPLRLQLIFLVDFTFVPAQLSFFILASQIPQYLS